jgi:tRNA(Ile)-lysidine synthase
MHKFVRNLITEWRRLGLPASDETVVVGVSGGADSVSLLLALAELQKSGKLDLRIVAAHFNHGLRPSDAARDEEFVKGLTSANSIELAIGRGKISKDGNLEQNARIARYSFLRRTAEKLRAHTILTAHTQNDQAETFLINLLRGSGLSGLSGMKPVRPISDQPRDGWNNEIAAEFDSLLPFARPPVLLARPLLTWAKRKDTENFCRENQVAFRYDSMNDDLAFSRVRVRKILIPMLEEFNPKAVETLCQTARLIQLENAAATENPAVSENGYSSDTLELKLLKKLDTGQLYRAIRMWLEQKRGNLRQLDMKHIEAIERLVLSRKSGKVVELPGGETVFKEGGRLVFSKLKVEK